MSTDKNQGVPTIQEFFSGFIIAFSGALFVFALLWMFFASIIWPNQNAQYQKEQYQIDDGFLVVWSPKIVPGDVENIDIQVTLYQKNKYGMPRDFLFIFPADFFVVSGANQYSQYALIHFSGDKYQETKIIQVRNSRIGHGLLGLFVSKQEISMYRHTQNEKAGKFLLAAEPNLRTTIRTSGGDGSNVPLFPLATLLVSVVGLIYREIQQKNEREENRMKRRKEQATSLIDAFKKNILDGNISIAQQNLEELSSMQLQEFTKDQSIGTANKLINITQGKVEEIDPDKLIRNGWEKETVAALVYAIENNPKDRDFLERALRSFPLEKITDEKYREKITTAAELFGTKSPLQSWVSEYPLLKPIPRFVINTNGLQENPFPYENAEDDESYLFRESGSLLWTEHPLLEKITTIDGAVLIYGNEGSGKTTFAKSLGRYRFCLDDPKTFSCYLRGAPAIKDIHTELARTLRSFIERLPSYLILLNDDQRDLLAQILVHEFGKNNVLGWLGTSSSWTWLQKTKNPDKRKIRESEVRTHINMLRDTVVKITPFSFTNQQWTSAFLTCLRSLNFKNNVYIVIDAGNDFYWDWYNETILQHQNRWQEININTITFSPLKSSSRTRKENSWLKRFEISWNEQNLVEMAHWRWNSIYTRPPRPHLDSIFAENSLRLMAKLSDGNPRCFIRLWNALFSNELATPVTKDMVQEARKQITCL
jgi:DNA polymerase III delta prime subunit